MKIIRDIKQGSPEWLALRVGKVTASALDRIVDGKGRLRMAKDKGSGLMSDGAETYLNEKIAEWMTGLPCDVKAGAYIDRGHEEESGGIAYVAWELDVAVESVACVLSDDERFLASPDGLIDDHSGVEIKTPGIVQHVANLRDMQAMVADHYAQIQGGMYATGRDRWYLCSWNPVLVSAIEPVDRDVEYIGNLHESLYGESGFFERLADAKEKMVARGFAPPAPPTCRGLDSMPCGATDVTQTEIGPLCAACKAKYEKELEACGM